MYETQVVTLFIMDFPWKFEVHNMYTAFFINQNVTSTIPSNTQKENVERQESVNMISGLSTTQKSNNFTKKPTKFTSLKFTFHGIYCHAIFGSICNVNNSEDICCIAVHYSRIELSFLFWWSCSKLSSSFWCH